MGGGESAKESHKRKRELAQKVREMKVATAATATQMLRQDMIEVLSSPFQTLEQPASEVEIIHSPP